MAVFQYDPELAKKWSNEVVDYLNGEGDSVFVCSKKFNEQMEKLVQPDVWTGSAASKNYQDFIATHNALIKFTNTFGDTFQEAMNKVNKSVADLELANLGKDTNVSSTFGTLSYNQLSALSEENINKSYVRYNYATIISIGSVLKNIRVSLENVNEGLKRKISELNSGSNIWDGDASENAKDSLLDVLNSNMPEIFDSLDTCIKNIETAGENAQAADSI